jgi:hypothetical protein
MLGNNHGCQRQRLCVSLSPNGVPHGIAIDEINSVSWIICWSLDLLLSLGVSTQLRNRWGIAGHGTTPSTKTRIKAPGQFFLSTTMLE